MKHLPKKDPQLTKLLAAELKRQKNGLEMIASENYVSPAVLECLGTVLTNKYSEGYPKKRYYSGNEIIDQIENLAIERAQKLFGADHANVQPHSGSQANAAAYFALLNPGDKILAMNLSGGGHLTHGSPVNFSGKFYNVSFYGVSQKTGQIDYDELLKIAQIQRPKMIIAGGSSYPRALDFAKFQEISRRVGSYLMVDMAHFAGLVCAGLYPNPVPFADIITSTSHKTLRGPRGAFILCNQSFADKVDKAVFPGIQGGPLEHVIAAKAICFKEAAGADFKRYQKQVLANAKTLEKIFLDNEITLISGGTDTHLLLLDVSTLGLSGGQTENLLAQAGIYVNKNVIPFDTRKPNDPSGIRLGTPALTTRGMKQPQMKLIGTAICNILKNPAEPKFQKEAKDLVAELVKKFPIYKELNY